MPICSTLELNDNFTFKSLRICYNKDLLQKKNIPVLKESGLASTGKPSAAERIQQGIPSTIDNIYDNKKIINNLIFVVSPSENGRSFSSTKNAWCKPFNRINRPDRFTPGSGEPSVLTEQFPTVNIN